MQYDHEEQAFEAYYEGLSPRERRERILLQPVYRDRYNELVQPDRIIQVPRYFWTAWVPQLGPIATTLYLSLRSHCYYNPKTGERRDWCWPKQSTLGSEIGVRSPHTIRKALKQLELFGFIEREATTHRYKDGTVRRGTDKYYVFFEIPLAINDAIKLLVSKSKLSQPLPEDHKGKKRAYGASAVDNPSRNGTECLSEARQSVPSQTSTLKRNVSNVSHNPKQSVPARSEIVSRNLAGERVDRLVFEIGDRLKNLARDKSSGPHKSAGFHRRIVSSVPENLIHEALSATRDAIDNGRSGHSGIRKGPAEYFAGAIRRIAERENIQLPIAWTSKLTG